MSCLFFTTALAKGIKVDINGMDKADILSKLYNKAKPQGMGLLHYDLKGMTREDAQEILDSGQTYFDYLKGRVMKIDLAGDNLQTNLYNRDNGTNAAELALE